MLLPMLAEMGGSIHIGLASLGAAIGVGLIGMGAASAVGRNPGAATPIPGATPNRPMAFADDAASATGANLPGKR